MRHYNRWRRYGDPTIFVRNQDRHGAYGTPTYWSWSGMQIRCYYPSNPSYTRYGGRGIKVCERWMGEHGFVNFLADMGEKPDGKSLDRIDNDGNYEPGNCKWSTGVEQQANRRSSQHSYQYSYCVNGHKQAGYNCMIVDGEKVCRKCL